MSFEIKITGHSPADHAGDVKDFAVSAARVLREKLGPGATVTLGGYATDSKLDLRFGDADVADAIARKDAAEAGLSAETEEVEATEAAAKRAKELKVDLATVKGTGAEGRITVGDVEKAAASA